MLPDLCNNDLSIILEGICVTEVYVYFILGNECIAEVV